MQNAIAGEVRLTLETLFTPYTIRGVTVPNRFAMAPMQRHKPSDFIPSREHAADYRARVEGGIGLVITQGTTMDHWSTSSAYARLFPPAYDGWKACVEAVREAGGHIFLQLWHEGANREGGFGPSGLTAAGELRGNPFTKDQIEEVTDLYARSAEIAKAIGFSGVELHGAHGHLIDQFFFAGSNKRDDEYGGDLAARMKFGLDVVRRVRSAVGDDYPIGMRISQWKGGVYDIKPCPTPDDLKAFLTPLVAAGIDVFHASARRFWVPEFEGSDLGYAGWVKAMSGIPTIAVGSIGLDTDMQSSFAGQIAKTTGAAGIAELERRFARGDFDLAAIGRAVLVEPDWVNKVRNRLFGDLRSELFTDEIRSTVVTRTYTMPANSA
ncbi:NADH oxidase [Alphaproteobacteria bacterium SO-S41]|nr:NADH oxidase [Alphaproteobacteria bacterium SO-S41]